MPMKCFGSAIRGVALVFVAAALSGCGIQDLAEAGTIQEDAKTSGYSEELKLTVTELVDAAKPSVSGHIAIDPTFLRAAGDACNRDRRELIRTSRTAGEPWRRFIQDPITATVAAAVFGGVVASVTEEINDALETRAKEFESNRSFAMNFGNLRPGTCFVASLSGKRPGDKDTVNLWHVAFAFVRSTVAPQTAALVLKPLVAKFDRSAAKKRDGGTFDVTLTVAITAAMPDDKAVGTLKEINKTEFSYKAIEVTKAAKKSSIEEGPVFPALPPGAFGVITVTMSEQGDGREVFRGAADFLDQHRKRVSDLLDQIVADRLSLDRIKYDKK